MERRRHVDAVSEKRSRSRKEDVQVWIKVALWKRRVEGGSERRLSSSPNEIFRSVKVGQPTVGRKSLSLDYQWRPHSEQEIKSTSTTARSHKTNSHKPSVKEISTWAQLVGHIEIMVVIFGSAIK